MSTQLKNRDHTTEYLVRCKQAIETLQTNGKPITYQSIMELADVPRSFVKTDPFFKHMFDQARFEYALKEMGHAK